MTLTAEHRTSLANFLLCRDTNPPPDLLFFMLERCPHVRTSEVKAGQQDTSKRPQTLTLPMTRPPSPSPLLHRCVEINLDSVDTRSEARAGLDTAGQIQEQGRCVETELIKHQTLFCRTPRQTAGSGLVVRRPLLKNAFFFFQFNKNRFRTKDI